MNDATEHPPAGWYPDPDDATGQRYWDGSQWTENRSPGQAAAPATAVTAPVGQSPVGQVGAQPVVVQPQQKTNGLAVAGMVLGILWLYWVGSVLAVIFGHVAKNQIDNSGGTQGGRGMAIAAIALGWTGVGIFLLFLVIGVGIGAS
jgi:hypothetical protein